MKITQHQLENNDLTHRYGGNGWAMVQDIDATHCRVAYIPKNPDKERFGGQAFMAHKDMLEPTVIAGQLWPIKSEYQEAVATLRKKLKSGELVVKSSHIVKA